MNRRRLVRTFWIGAAACVVVAALIALTAVLRGEFSDTDGRILGTMAALLLASATLFSGLLLIDRDNALLGRAAVVLAPVGFVLLAYAIWDFVFDRPDDAWRYGWTGALVLVAATVAVTARLLAESPSLTRLAFVTGFIGSLAAGISTSAVWGHESDSVGKVIATLWIVTVACYLLVPVLERLRGSVVVDENVHVLASLHDVELVLTRSSNGLVVELTPGERLALRRRAGVRAATD